MPRYFLARFLIIATTLAQGNAFGQNTLGQSRPAIRLTVIGGRPIAVEVYVNGAGPFRFLLDTGAQTNQIEVGLARRLGLRAEFRVEMATVAGAATVAGGRAAVVSMGPLEAGEQEFLFTRVPASAGMGIQLDGVLGQEFLGRFDYLLDLKQKRLMAVASPEGPRLPFERADGRMVVATSAGRLVVDSGADSVVLFGARAGGSPGPSAGSIVTAAGATAAERVEGLCLRVGERRYYPDAAARVARAEAEADGLVPASLFGALYVSNSGGYVILNLRMAGENQLSAKAAKMGLVKGAQRFRRD